MIRRIALAGMVGNMKKWFKGLMVVVLFSVSMLSGMKPVQAMPWAIPLMSLGGGAGWTAVGKYAVEGVLVAAGGAALINDAIEGATAVKQKAEEVWNNLTEVEKTEFAGQVQRAYNPTTGSLKLEGDLGNFVGTISNKVADGAYRGVKDYEATKILSTSVPSYMSHSYQTLVVGSYSSDWKTRFHIVNMVTGREDTVSHLRIANWFEGSQMLQYGDGSNYSFSDQSTNSWNPNRYEQVKGLNSLSSLMAYISAVFPLLKVDYAVPGAEAPARDYYTNSVAQTLGGINEINIPLDQFLARTTTGQALQYNETTGTLQLDGKDYTGAWEWARPNLKVGAGAGDIGFANPAIDAGNVVVGEGDVPFVKDRAETDTGVGEGDTGAGTGLWGWLKDLLNLILNAIKAIAGAVTGSAAWAWLTSILSNIIAAIQALAGAITAPISAALSGISSLIGTIAGAVATAFMNVLVGDISKVNWQGLKMAGNTFTTQFPFSLPWDIARGLDAVFGGFSETNKAPVWQWKIPAFNRVYSFDLTFPDFLNSWSPFIKGVLLITFDVGLIYSIRRLLGGAS